MPDTPLLDGDARKCDWLNYREVQAEFGIKKTALYGSISKLVGVRKLPGDSTKWNRADLERLCRKHTSKPLPDVEPNTRRVPGKALRFPKVRGHEVNGVDSDRGVRRCLASARRTRPSSSSRPRG